MGVTERWVSAVGWEGAYEVSSLGRIRSIDRQITQTNGATYFRKGQLIKSLLYGRNYLSVLLQVVGGKKQCLTVHKMVAKAFLPNPDGKPYVNHIDLNKTNNCVENLEWVTPSENLIHAIAAGAKKPPPVTFGEANVRSKLTAAAVIAAREAHRGGTSIKDLARENGVSVPAMYQAVKGIGWAHIPGALPRRTNKRPARAGA